jgi:hypothetical protein
VDRTFKWVDEGEVIKEQEGVEGVLVLGSKERSKRTPAPLMAICGSMVWEMVLRLFM